jgi:hypothetical protein
MASFSSRGPDGDWIKPDVTAPGVQVLAGTTPQPDQTTADNGPPGNLYMAIAGTSMASPHSAGVSALVKAAHPTWTPEEIKSALMTSANTKVVEEDGSTPATPFDMGAGRISASRAVSPTLVFNETYAHFVAAGTNVIHRVDLNIPSIDETTFSGDLLTHRTALNVSGKNQILHVKITEPKGVTITVGTKNHDLVVAKNHSITFPIDINAPDVADGQYFARITLIPKSGGTPVTIPVAFVKQQGSVTLSQTCSPLSIKKVTGVSHCSVTAQNFGSAAANASITVAGRASEVGNPLRFKNVALPGVMVGAGHGLKWSGSLTPASAPLVTSINNITGTGPAGGYLALSGFGITPITGVGDETISNFDVPTFYYGGEPYSAIGIVSNGYVVIGGGSGPDVNYYPQTFPNAATPNNVVAPFWTDLNPPAGGAIRIATLSDGANTWLVVDFAAVKDYSDAVTHTGELWFQLDGGAAGTGPVSEQVTMDYGDANAGHGDPGSAMNWGAENRDGTSGQNIASAPASGSEYRPVLSGPVPGGIVTLPFDLFSAKTGAWHSDAKLTSDQTAGTTITSQKITVHS